MLECGDRKQKLKPAVHAALRMLTVLQGNCQHLCEIGCITTGLLCLALPDVPCAKEPGSSSAGHYPYKTPCGPILPPPGACRSVAILMR